jgi:mono/diheme cytochrome c family protein
MRRTPALAAVAAALAMAGACKSEHHFEPPDRADQVRQAEALYTPALFDTITWASDSVRALDGNAVFAAKCRRCHGTLGRGGTDYAAARDLAVPSLVEPDWPLAASIDSLRHVVFVGHAAGMPTFGIAGITLREIDAASYYVLNRLRPDVLGAEGGSE